MKKFILAFFTMLLSGTVALANPTQRDGNQIFQVIKKTVEHPLSARKSQAKDKMVQAELDEQQYMQIERELLFKWIQNWKEKRPELKSFPKNSGSFAIYSPKKSNMRIQSHNWLKQNGANYDEYLNGLKKVEDFDLVTTKVKIKESWRKADGQFKKAILHVRYDLRGINQENLRRNDRGTLKVTVSSKNKIWKIDHIEIGKMQTLIATMPAFKEATADLNLDKIKVYRREEAIRRGGYALSVADYNNDGNVDLYVGAMGDSQILKGTKDGKFTPDHSVKLPSYNLIKSAIFADFDNSGTEDLLLVRFASREKRHNELTLFRNENGKFVKSGKVDTKGERQEPMPATIGDMDNDKLLDIYVGYPGKRDFTVMEDRVVAENGKKVHGLYFNQSNFKFKDKTQKIKDKLATIHDKQLIFPHSAMSFDLDKDNDMDIVVIDDRGNVSPMYLNDGQGNFSPGQETLGILNRQYGMSIAVGDVNNDGYMDIGLTNVNFNSATRLNNSAIENQKYKTSMEQRGLYGLRLYLGSASGKFWEATGMAGLSFAGEGMAGLEFIDYDNDGDLDIYVANGLWSGTNKKYDYSSLFVRSDGDMYGNMFDALTLDGNIKNFDKKDKDFDENETYSYFMRVLQHQRIGKSKDRPSLAGFQRNRLFRNNGKGKFTEVGYLEGVDSIADGYTVALADINKDNKMDLILRNGDPGTKDVHYPAVQAFVNNLPNDNSVILSLESINSNRQAIGSFVTAVMSGETHIRHLKGNGGTVQSEKILHFGLGKHKKIDELIVVWPNGAKEVYKNVQPGRHHIKEGTSIKTAAH